MENTKIDLFNVKLFFVLFNFLIMIIEEEFFFLLKFLINFDVVFVQEKNFIYRTILFDVEAIELGKIYQVL